MPNKILAYLTIPGLRHEDLPSMPNLSKLFPNQTPQRLDHSFPAVTWPSQATTLTGKLPSEHGAVANGYYWRDKHQVEMWTAWNETIQQPQIWDRLHQINPQLTSAAWFEMLSKGSGADYVCMPAPIHRPDGSEDLWCYTKPQEFYGELLEQLGQFPLMNFWGPLANIKSTKWISDSVQQTAAKFRPRFLYVYLPHLDYAAQKLGPNSPEAQQAVVELDAVIGELAAGLSATYADDSLTWIAGSEYVITEVDHVTYPNRMLREAGLLTVAEQDAAELIDFASTPAWALVDHQFSHVFVKDADPQVIQQTADVFRQTAGIDEVLVLDERAKYGMDHERSGEIILISSANSWQAYYWWLDDDRAPSFARTVDIHRKPGYDPVELHFDFQTKTTPLDATLIRGSHGAPPKSEAQRGVFWCSDPQLLPGDTVADTDICTAVETWFQRD